MSSSCSSRYFFGRIALLRVLPIVLLSTISALSACSTLPGPSSSQPSPAAAAPQSAAGQVIRTEAFEPQPIRITLEQLPKPYASRSASKPPHVAAVPADPVLKLPKGFVINVFADGLDKPRWLALTPNGEVLVTETRQNRILKLRDANGDGKADERKPFATAENGLNLPFGMAFAGNSFYVGNTDGVLRFAYAEGQDRVNDRGETIAELPGQGYNQHWTRNVVAAPDGQKLYVSVGSRSNADEEPLPRASIQVLEKIAAEPETPPTWNRKTFASGLRNPVGLDFHPKTNALYTTVNERDQLGDNLVPDYLTQVEAGQFYGWPYTYLSKDRLDPRHMEMNKSTRPDLASKTQTPDVLFEAHSAALGLKFYTGNTFPEKYRQGAFVAFRGSWNRSQGTGYKVVFVPFTQEGKPQGYYEDFLTGFLLDPAEPITWGRPVGLLVLKDGSLLITDEGNDRIYRVQYQG